MDGWVDIEAGKMSDAIVNLTKANQKGVPAFVGAWLGYAYGVSGDRAHAMGKIENQNKNALHGYVQPFNLAIIHLGLGDQSLALDYLEKAYDADLPWLAWLKKDHAFDPLRAEPRFKALLKKLHFEK
jgi:hypothetical protein